METHAHVIAYFDFLCPWCYIGKIRMEKAIKHARVKTNVEWVPIELYAHQEGHRIQREHIHGNEHLDSIYRQLSLVAAEEKIIIRQHPYEKSSRRALTGILFAREHGNVDEYMRDVYSEVFEYGNDISSLMVLGRIALKLGWPVEEFLRFVDEKKNQAQMVHASEQAKHAGVHGVPTYVINGFTLAGTIPTHELAAVLKERAREITGKTVFPRARKAVKSSRSKSRALTSARKNKLKPSKRKTSTNAAKSPKKTKKAPKRR